MIKRHRFNESLKDRVTRLESALRRSTRNRRRFEADGEDRYEVVGLDYTDRVRHYFDQTCRYANAKASIQFERKYGIDTDKYLDWYHILLGEVESDNGREVLVPGYGLDEGQVEEIDKDIVFGTEGYFIWQNGELVKTSYDEVEDIMIKKVNDLNLKLSNSKKSSYAVVGLDYTSADRNHYEDLCYKATLKGSAQFEKEQGKDYPESYCTLRLREVESGNGVEVLVPAYSMDDGREEEIVEDIVFGTKGCFKWKGGRLVKISDRTAINFLAQGVYDIDSENTDWYGYEDDEEYESVRRSARNLRMGCDSLKR